MKHSVEAIIPIRSFEGMTRLSEWLGTEDRMRIARDLADRTVRAALDAATQVSVVTADAEVRRWALATGVDVIDEQASRGLDAAAATGLNEIGDDPWFVIHADLPAVTPADIRAAADMVEHRYVLAPSHDGGTSLIGGTGSRFPFRYGPGSFGRHLSALRGEAAILVRPGLALDLDRPWDLRALRRLGYLKPGTEY